MAEVVVQKPPIKKATTAAVIIIFFIFKSLYPCRAQPFIFRLLYKLFGIRCIVRVGEEDNKKKPAPQSYLEVKALVCPK
jgi:hypothetical protein